ncbi:MAG: hypothetical protein PHY78_04105 [Desulfobacterales bacterium]|nr:hypothetical protein [Desulfobacterales bacterium]MDD4391820.1 hypothetical protein [Desulfobacterales bacterium]
MEQIHRKPVKEEPFKLEQHLRSAPSRLKDKAAPEPDWTECATSLNSSLDEWLQNRQSETLLRVFLKVPYSGLTQALVIWAKQSNFRIIEAPVPEQLIHGKGYDVSGQIDNSGNLLVIPCLERFFLRHFNGLSMIRQLIDSVLSCSCPCLIGCDSWAWAYLSKALGVDRLFPVPFVLEAFDQEKLQQWFCRLACGAGGDRLVFRQSNNGNYVLPLKAEHQQEESADHASPTESSNFLIHLAAYSRGIAGIAWDIWRYSLRYGPDEERTDLETDSLFKQTIWVDPWSQLTLPAVSDGVTHDELLVLHCLMIHGELDARLLANLLPMSDSDVMQAIMYLRSKGLIYQNKNRWYATAIGYPAVRRFLSNEGYLVDSI